MATFSQSIFSGAFSWMESVVFWLKLHWSLFLMVKLTINQHWPQVIIWTNADPIHWRIYAALGGDEFNAGPIWIRDPNLCVTVPADALTPIGCRPSAATMLTAKLDTFSYKFCWLSMIPWHFYKPVISFKMAGEISRYFEFCLTQGSNEHLN